jgi:hypothetical protein
VRLVWNGGSAEEVLRTASAQCTVPMQLRCGGRWAVVGGKAGGGVGFLKWQDSARVSDFQGADEVVRTKEYCVLRSISL